jgi:hypothetical protein
VLSQGHNGLTRKIYYFETRGECSNFYYFSLLFAARRRYAMPYNLNVSRVKRFIVVEMFILLLSN